MDRFTSGIHKRRNRKLKFPDYRVLAGWWNLIGFDQRIPEVCDIFILDTFPI